MKLIPIFTLFILTMSCTLVQVPETPTLSAKFSSVDEVWRYIDKNITYYHAPGDTKWKYPQDTYDSGTGDCADMAVLMAQAIWDMGEYCTVVRIDIGVAPIYHVVVKYNGLYLDAQHYLKYWWFPDVVREFNQKEVYYKLWTDK